MRIAPCLALLLGAACGPAAGPTALHDLDRQSDFFALPFPNDLRLDSDGKIDLTGFPKGLSSIIDGYVSAFDHRLDGWGTQSAIYFRFDGAIAVDSLPSVHDSVTEASSVLLVDVTPDSPTYGQRTPVLSSFRVENGDYIRQNWLALRPAPGFPLREKTTYAALVLDMVRGLEGGRVHAAPGLARGLAVDGPAAYAPLRAWLAANPPTAAHLVNATVFTTEDATGTMRRLRLATYQKAPAPTVKNLAYLKSTALWDAYVGEYDAPNFQAGQEPYVSEGGRIVDDSDGLPSVQHMETLRFALTVPRSPMPAGGWPLVVYAHGTGGDYQDFIVDKSADGVAHVVDAAGATIADLAMISIDQPLHGARDPGGAGPGLVFNLGNVDAAVDNLKQGAADDYSLVRMVLGFSVDAAPKTGLPLRFDPDRLYFKGHSQGGITGALFLGFEPALRGAILSGTGGTIVETIVAKPEYLSALALVIDEPHDATHPVLNLFQTFAESSDPANFARTLLREPEPNVSPKSVFVSMGLGDTDTPNVTTWSFVEALGAQPILPMLLDSATLDLAGLAWGASTPPVVDNAANGAATAVFLQYTPPGKRDGHFVIFDVPAARDQSNRFLATYARDGKATLSAP